MALSVSSELLRVVTKIESNVFSREERVAGQ